MPEAKIIKESSSTERAVKQAIRAAVSLIPVAVTANPIFLAASPLILALGKLVRSKYPNSKFARFFPF